MLDEKKFAMRNSKNLIFTYMTSCNLNAEGKKIYIFNRLICIYYQNVEISKLIK